MLTNETIDLWLKAVNGKITGFSQIRLRDVCQDFAFREPDALKALWNGNSSEIYPALLRMRVEDNHYQRILKSILFAIAEECLTSDESSSVPAEKIQVSQSLTPDEWLDIVYLKSDLRRFLNAEIAELAFANLISAPSHESTIVEVLES